MRIAHAGSMGTVITGVFCDHMAAQEAAARLEHAGFPRSTMRLVDATTPDRHAFIQRRVADTRRAVLIGLACGPVLGAIAGVLLASLFDTSTAVVAGVLGGAVGGSVLGFLVGRTTTTQMTDELEHLVEGGAVVVRMFVDQEQAESVARILGEFGEAQIVTTGATFLGGTVARAHAASGAYVRGIASGGSSEPGCS